MAGTEPSALEALRTIDELIGELEARSRDSIDEERLAGLRARRERLWVEVQVTRSVPERDAPRQGLWAPLPMAEAQAFEPPREVPRPETPTPNPSSSPVTVPAVLPGDEDRRVVEAVEEILRGRPAGPVGLLRELAKTPALSARSLRLIAAVFAQVGSDADAQKVRARIFTTERPAPMPPRVEPVFETVPTPFVPSIDDGLTADQRVMVKALAARGSAYVTMESVVQDSVTLGLSVDRADAAMAELLLPRRYALVDTSFEGQARVRLSALAREMTSPGADGEVRIHGGFFPNVLVNGCATPLAFPTHRLADVFAAAERLMANPGATAEHLVNVLQGPDLPEQSAIARLPTTLYRTGVGSLELDACLYSEVAPEGRSMTLTWVDAVSAEVAADAIDSWKASGLLDGVGEVMREGRVIRVALDHAAFAWAIKRLLRRTGLFTRRSIAQFRVERGAGPETVWLGALLFRLVENSRNEIRRRHGDQSAVGADRVETLRAFLRAIDEQDVARVLDCCLDTREAVWALTHLGSEAFRQHPVFGPMRVTAGPFERRHAEQIVATPRLAQRRKAYLSELEALSALPATTSSDAVDALVKEAFGRVLRLVGDDPRRTVLPDRARVV